MTQTCSLGWGDSKRKRKTREENIFYHSLQEASDVVLAAGGPGKGGTVVHQLSRHDEGVSPRQLAVIALTIMVDSKTGREPYNRLSYDLCSAYWINSITH